MTTATPTTIYLARRQVLLNEVGEHLAIYPGKWLVYPYDNKGPATFDAQGYDTKRDAQNAIRELRSFYPTAEVINL